MRVYDNQTTMMLKRNDTKNKKHCPSSIKHGNLLQYDIMPNDASYVVGFMRRLLDVVV